MTLPELLQRCAAGDEDLQTALLDEVEPLLFGYVRSLLPQDDAAFDRAVALTHAAVLGFLLDLRAGRIRIADAGGLPGASHRIALAVLRLDPPAYLTALGDAETGALTPSAVRIAREWERVLGADGARVAAAHLQGRPAAGWNALVPALTQADLLRCDVPDRDEP